MGVGSGDLLYQAWGAWFILVLDLAPFLCNDLSSGLAGFALDPYLPCFLLFLYFGRGGRPVAINKRQVKLVLMEVRQIRLKKRYPCTR